MIQADRHSPRRLRAYAPKPARSDGKSWDRAGHNRSGLISLQSASRSVSVLPIIVCLRRYYGRQQPFLRIFYALADIPHRAFMPPCPTQAASPTRRVPPSMLDILVAVLGTGGILLMAAYAALCDRI